QSRLAHRGRLVEPAHGLGSNHTLSLGAKGKSRGTLPRGFAGERRGFWQRLDRGIQECRGLDASAARADSRDAGLSEAGDRGKQMKPHAGVQCGCPGSADRLPNQKTATLRIWRGNAPDGGLSLLPGSWQTPLESKEFVLQPEREFFPLMGIVFGEAAHLK